MLRIIPFVMMALLLTGCGEKTQTDQKIEEPQKQSAGTIQRIDASINSIIPADAVIEKVADGFSFTEGPLWRAPGVLWFSDVLGNVVREWSPQSGVTEILRPGGFDGAGAPVGSFIGPNGMVAGPDGSVLLCQHGNRRIVQIDRDRKVSTFIDRYQGKRLNSPNDLVFHPDGSLYFTDPPYGLAKQDEDPGKELKFNGVYRYVNKKLQLVSKDLSRPNGLAFSPDGKVLYVANSDEQKKIWMRYDVKTDGTLTNGKIFADVTANTSKGLPDGMKVDAQGNVYATGPGGVWVFHPDGKHLGTIATAETPANCGWGDDGKTLYITAETGIYKIRLAVEGLKGLYQ